MPLKTFIEKDKAYLMVVSSPDKRVQAAVRKHAGEELEQYRLMVVEMPPGKDRVVPAGRGACSRYRGGKGVTKRLELDSTVVH